MSRDSKHIQQKQQAGTPVSLPSMNTPLTGQNLEEMIDEMFFNAGWVNNLMTSINYDDSNGVVTITWNDSAATTQTATVTLNPFDTGDLTEGSNLYYTDTRVRNAISVVSGSVNYNSSTGVITVPETTSHVTEGSNLYYTNERVDDRVSNLIQNGTGISWSYADGAGTLTPTISLSPFSTSDLSEGTNLYYTDTRARASISVSGSLSYNSGTGEISFTERTDAQVRALISATGSLSYVAATGVISYTERADQDIRDIFSAGGDLSYDSSTGEFSITSPSVPSDTDGLSEGAVNLYYTDARVRAAISATGSLSYDSGTGVISYTQRSDTTIRELFSATGSISYDSGTGVFSFTDVDVNNYVTTGTVSGNTLTLTRNGLGDVSIDVTSLNNSGIGGTLTTGFVPVATGASTLGNSSIFDGSGYLMMESNTTSVTTTFTSQSLLYGCFNCDLTQTLLGSMDQSAIMFSNDSEIEVTNSLTPRRNGIFFCENVKLANVESAQFFGIENGSVTTYTNTYDFTLVANKLAMLNPVASTNDQLVVRDSTSGILKSTTVAFNTLVQNASEDYPVQQAGSLHSNNDVVGPFVDKVVRVICIESTWTAANPKTLDIDTFIDESSNFDAENIFNVEVGSRRTGTGGDNYIYGMEKEGAGDNEVNWRVEKTTNVLELTRYGHFTGGDYDNETFVVAIWYFETSFSTS